MIDLDYLDSLPKRMSMNACLIEKYNSLWNTKIRFTKRYLKYNIFYDLSERILKNNIGKSFDMAYHYWCKKVKRYPQYKSIFYDRLYVIHKERYSNLLNKYDIIDGNIQYTQKYINCVNKERLYNKKYGHKYDKKYYEKRDQDRKKRRDQKIKDKNKYWPMIPLASWFEKYQES